MHRKFTLVLLVAVGLGLAPAIPTSAATSAQDWPFDLLPKPADFPINPPPAIVLRSPGSGPITVLKQGVPQSGEYSAPIDGTINLDQTTGKSFRLSGEVWLDGPVPGSKHPGDCPQGFSLYLREVDGLHRYEANSNLIRDKRRYLAGNPLTKIENVATLPAASLHQWIAFSVVATEDKISFTFGKSSVDFLGPLAMNGKNEIALAIGTKLRNIQLDILPEVNTPPATPPPQNSPQPWTGDK